VNVIVVGCGRVGGTLAGSLDANGHAVTVIDIDKAAFTHLPAAFAGTTLLGNGADLDLLRRAEIEKAEAFLALTEGDNRNLMAAQIAKEFFGVRQVVAKVNDPIRAQMYRARGIATFSRTTILATLLEAQLMGDLEVGKLLLERSLAREAELAGGMRHQGQAAAAKR
jgi:trk system potassium uptake protein TrkA